MNVLHSVASGLNYDPVLGSDKCCKAVSPATLQPPLTTPHSPRPSNQMLKILAKVRARAPCVEDITVHMKYARYVEDLNRREDWYELVSRNMEMHIKST